MRLKISPMTLVAGLIAALMLSGMGFAQGIAKRHVAVGTISSIDDNQVVINENVKGNEQPMTFMLDPGTKKTGYLAVGSRVAIHYRRLYDQKVATSILEL